ncbi:MAG: ATP-binding protein [Verrucomicrobiae bacterium]|nr:ATP-binding protein [Verrucomicrobiae bacterium]
MRTQREETVRTIQELERELSSLREEVQKARENEAKARAIYEGTSDAVMLATEQGFLDGNPRALKMYGFASKEEFIHTHPGNLSPPTQPDGRDSLTASLEEIRTGFEKGTHRFEWVHKRANGETFPAEVLLTAFDYGGRRVLQATVQDITERKQAEAKEKKFLRELDALNRRLKEHEEQLVRANEQLRQEITEREFTQQNLEKSLSELEEIHAVLKENQAQLLQSEKMASLGQLAAGVAHEINNPTSFIMSNLGTLTQYVGAFKQLLSFLDMLEESVRSADHPRQQTVMEQIRAFRTKEDLPFILNDVDSLLKESLDGARRVKEIVLGLKSFAHIDEAEIAEVDLNESLNTTLKLIWNELKYKCQVHKKFGGIPRIRSYPGQLNQVFMNLLVNAAQAIPEKGEITIETSATPEHVLIRISDTGCGIPPENLPKLFTPFFTTKPVGKGTGLGLSISYGIVKKHDGTINVESRAGQGTTFTILLPRTGVKEDGFV